MKHILNRIKSIFTSPSNEAKEEKVVYLTMDWSKGEAVGVSRIGKKLFALSIDFNNRTPTADDRLVHMTNAIKNSMDFFETTGEDYNEMPVVKRTEIMKNFVRTRDYPIDVKGTEQKKVAAN